MSTFSNARRVRAASRADDSVSDLGPRGRYDEEAGFGGSGGPETLWKGSFSSQHPSPAQPTYTHSLVPRSITVLLAHPLLIHSLAVSSRLAGITPPSLKRRVCTFFRAPFPGPHTSSFTRHGEQDHYQGDRGQHGDDQFRCAASHVRGQCASGSPIHCPPRHLSLHFRGQKWHHVCQCGYRKPPICASLEE